MTKFEYGQVRRFCAASLPLGLIGGLVDKMKYMTNAQFMTEARRHRKEIRLWPIAWTFLSAIIILTLQFTYGDPPAWVGILFIIGYLLGYGVLAKRISKLPCPECGQSALLANQFIFGNYVRCRKCGYQINGSPDKSPPEEPLKHKNWTFPGV